MIPPALTYETEHTIIRFAPLQRGETAATVDHFSILFTDEIPESFDAALADFAANRTIDIEIAHNEAPGSDQS